MTRVGTPGTPHLRGAPQAMLFGIACWAAAGCFEGSDAADADAAGRSGQDAGADNGDTGGSADVGEDTTGRPSEPLRVLVEGENDPASIAVDDRYVYWTTGDELRRAPLSGGEATTLASARNMRDLVVLDGQVFFVSIDAAWRVDREGAEPEQLAAALQARALAVHGDDVYWTNSGMTDGDGSIGVASVDGTTSSLLLEGLLQPSGVAVDEAFVYFTSSGMSCGASSSGGGGCSGGGVHKIARDGGDPTPVSGEGTPYSIVRGERGLYWMAMFPPRIVFADLDSGQVRTLAEIAGDDPGPIAVDADALYFSSIGEGRVLKLPLDGGERTPIVTDLGSIYGIALDDDWVYVAATEAGRILRVAKDGSAAVPTDAITGPCPTPLGSEEQIASTPRDDENLELLSLQLDADEVVATQATYDRVVADIAAVRALAPELADIEYRAPYDGKTLSLRPNDATYAAFEAGLYSAWDCLNEFYELESLTSHEFTSLNLISITLKGRYNLRLLAALYGQLPGIEGAEVDGTVGDGPSICATRNGSEFRYVLDRADGDCPSGCITHDAHLFVSSAPGEVEARGSWNSESGQPAPAWFCR